MYLLLTDSVFSQRMSGSNNIANHPIEKSIDKSLIVVFFSVKTENAEDFDKRYII